MAMCPLYLMSDTGLLGLGLGLSGYSFHECHDPTPSPSYLQFGSGWNEPAFASEVSVSGPNRQRWQLQYIRLRCNLQKKILDLLSMVPRIVALSSKKNVLALEMDTVDMDIVDIR